MIVIEGPDNSGKSTLADLLARTFQLHKYTAGPAPKTHLEMMNCLNRQQAMAADDCVHDRVTCISHQVYWGPNGVLQFELDRMVDTPGCIVVYCRPPERTLMDFSTHRVKGYDTEESLKKIIDNQHRYIQAYDLLMSGLPAVTYDWTDESQDPIKLAGMIVPALYNARHWENIRRKFTPGSVIEHIRKAG